MFDSDWRFSPDSEWLKSPDSNTGARRMNIMNQNSNKQISFLEKHPKINTAIGVILLLVICGIIILLTRKAIKVLIVGITKLTEMASHLEAVVIVALITGAVSVTGVIISSIVAKIIDYRKNRQEYLTRKREKSYEAFIAMVYRIADSSKEGSEYTPTEMIRDMQLFSQELTLWGSKRVVRKWIAYRNNAINYSNPKDNLAFLEEIINEMRRDMGTGKTNKWEILKLFINDIDE